MVFQKFFKYKFVKSLGGIAHNLFRSYTCYSEYLVSTYAGQCLQGKCVWWQKVECDLVKT